jgi:hypothetical protein
MCGQVELAAAALGQEAAVAELALARMGFEHSLDEQVGCDGP